LRNDALEQEEVRRKRSGRLWTKETMPFVLALFLILEVIMVVAIVVVVVAIVVVVVVAAVGVVVVVVIPIHSSHYYGCA
jgi:Flp pilus assembly protein TadB